VKEREHPKEERVTHEVIEDEQVMYEMCGEEAYEKRELNRREYSVPVGPPQENESTYVD
jgi:hypothetical protein